MTIQFIAHENCAEALSEGNRRQEVRSGREAVAIRTAEIALGDTYLYAQLLAFQL